MKVERIGALQARRKLSLENPTTWKRRFGPSQEFKSISIG
jgi:hypothetical protein